jgi:hypothetical protein
MGRREITLPQPGKTGNTSSFIANWTGANQSCTGKYQLIGILGYIHPFTVKESSNRMASFFALVAFQYGAINIPKFK